MMPGLILSLVLLLSPGLLSPAGTPAGQADGCADLDAYLTSAGEHITDRLDSLLADDEWAGAFAASIDKANEPGTGILALSTDEIAPVIALIAVPGEALAEIPADEVPPIARELHDSALRYHQTMPEMLNATNRGGMYASMPFSDTIEAAAADNLAAQRAVREACPSLVAEIETFRDANAVPDLNSALTDPSSLDPAVLEAMTPETHRAFAFPMLFFAQDQDDAQAQHPDAPPPATRAPQEAGGGKSSGFAKIGDPAPDFEMQTFDGETFRLSEHRGEVVIVNFWGSWCPPCREEMPAFQEAWENADDDVVFVGVGSKRDSEDEAKAFADEFGVTYPIGRDTEGGTAADGQITKDYNILVYPTTYIIDTEGNISAIVMYAMDMDDLAGYIDQARNP